MAKHQITITVNGAAHEARGRVAAPARPLPPRDAAADRHAHRLRHDALRRLHGAARRHAGQVVHGARRPGRRPPGHDGRRASSRTASSHPIQEGFCQEHGLQCGYCTPGMMMTSYALLKTQPEPERGRDPAGDLRQPLPLHRLRQHRQGGPARGGRHERGPAGQVGGAMEPKTSADVGGMGHSMKRKEDPRFIRGQGNYVDDIKLPGMLYMDIVRSPYAHAKILKIDTAKALKMPGVLAVITGETLEKYNLHWMPTLMSDTQMVLPTDNVMYQAQEVAAVIATDRYIAADGVDGGRGRLRAAAGRRRSVQGARAGRAGAAHRQEGQEGQPHLALGGGRPGGDRQGASPTPTSSSSENIYIPRIHVASIETCGCVADFDPRQRQAHGLHDDAGAARDPHGVRAGGRACRAVGGEDPHHLARHRRRLRRQGAGLPRLRHRASRPRWSSASRSSGSRTAWRTCRPTPSPATTTWTAELAAEEGRHDDRRCGSRRSPTTATPTPRRTRRSSRPGSSRSAPARTTCKHAFCEVDGGLHQQAAGRRRLSLLVPRHRGGAHDRAHGRHAGARAEDGPGRRSG